MYPCRNIGDCVYGKGALLLLYTDPGAFESAARIPGKKIKIKKLTIKNVLTSRRRTIGIYEYIERALCTVE